MPLLNTLLMKMFRRAVFQYETVRARIKAKHTSV
jgi:hypothetical protein